MYFVATVTQIPPFAGDGTPLGAEDWRDAYGPRMQLRKALASGLVGLYGLELALGTRPGELERYAGDNWMELDQCGDITEAQEIALVTILEQYRDAIRTINVQTAQDRIARG